MSTAAGNRGGFVYIPRGYLQKTFDNDHEMCYHITVQGSDEDMPR